jgi:hypothetical protein
MSSCMIFEVSFQKRSFGKTKVCTFICIFLIIKKRIELLYPSELKRVSYNHNKNLELYLLINKENENLR